MPEDQFPSGKPSDFFSMHVMRATCVVHRAQHPLFTRVTTSRCISVGGPSFAFIWRKTMLASREELIGTFENITTEQAGVTKSQLTTECNKYYVSAFSSSFSRILHQFDEKEGKKEVKKSIPRCNHFRKGEGKETRFWSRENRTATDIKGEKKPARACGRWARYKAISIEY